MTASGGASASTQDLLLAALGAGGSIPETGSRFQILGELGRGGMGVVLRVFDRHLRREVAMKVLAAGRTRPESVARFLEEAQVTGQLDHPNIIPVHEVGIDANHQLFIVMKLVRGASLKERMRQLLAAVADGGGDGAFPLAERIDVFRKVCDGVALAHDRGVLHRDLKPENVMVGEFGEVLVMDWGLARLADAGEPLPPRPPSRPPSGVAPPVSVAGSRTERVVSDRRERAVALTEAGVIEGTPAYMAPEQANGDSAAITERTDVFCLGTVLYELVSGGTPYKGKVPLAVVAEASRGHVVPVATRARERGMPRVPTELQAIIRKAMAFRPRDRYASVLELAEDIEAWRAYRPLQALRETPVRRAVKWVRRHPLATMAAAFVSVLAAVAAFSAAWVTESARDAAAQEAHRLRAEDAARRDRERMRAAELRELAQRGEMDRLFDELGATVRHKRSRLVDEFLEFYYEKRRESGAVAEDFIGDLDPAKITDYIEAFEELARLASIDESLASAEEYRMLALLYFYGRGDAQRSLDAIDRALELDPQNATLYGNRSIALRELGRRDEAIADLEHAIRADPDNASGHFNLAMARREEGNLPEAIRLLDRAVELAPHDPIFVAMRGSTRHAAGDVDGALVDCTTAIELAPGYSTAWYNRGNIHNRRENYPAAIHDYSESIRLDGTYPEAWTNRAICRLRIGEPDTALSDLDRALALNPDLPQALNWRGRIRADRRDFANARTDLERLLVVRPDWRTRARVGELRLRTGDRESGVAALQHAWRECDDEEFRDRIADVLRQAGADVPD